MCVLNPMAVACLILSVATAEYSHGWVGFKQETDVAVPSTIAKAAGSVFQIIYAHGEPEVKDVSAIDVKAMSTSGSDWFKIVQVKMCQIQKIKNCPVMPEMFTGTAFLIKDQQTIATNLHNVQAWVYHAKKLNPDLVIENIQAPILLGDKDQNLVFNPMEGTATLKLAFYNKSPATFAQEYPWSGGDKRVYFRVSDYVELHANVPFNAVPLKFGKLESRTDALFTVGFPNPTTVFAKHGGVDSPGYDRWVSKGQLKPSTVIENINIMTDIAAAPGSSGSPLLKKNGEVVGILFAGGVDEIGGVLTAESQFLQSDFALMLKVWSQFDVSGNLQ